ncbi:MAG: ABC transporter ATP-binding protein [Anaerolineales bacterium]|nr:ABC transporter ATP-binding protein [Anaerolineales bacterium]
MITQSAEPPVLQLDNLTAVFPLKRGIVRAVTNVDLTLARGEILGLVGESGCGKSATMLSILRLLPYPGKIVAGQVLLKGDNILARSPRAIRQVRGKSIAMIFQDPMSTLNPAFPIAEQIGESMRIHRLDVAPGNRRPWLFDFASRQREQERVLALLEEVGIPRPKDTRRCYPHELSGGMQQRVLIAIALSCAPDVLLADEPTTALDVTVQAQIVDLLNRINRERHTSIILVTHNLGLAAEFCHRIAVMYAGQIVEQGPTVEVVENSLHPYTQGLLNCIPRITRGRKKISPIPGNVPDPIDLPLGCAFQPRCASAHAECLGRAIPLVEAQPNRLVRCVLYTGRG